jgi:hypothetical protein
LSDDFDALFDAAPTSTPPAATTLLAPTADEAAIALAAPAVAEEAEAPGLWLALYKPGADVQYEGAAHKVNHVHISRKGLFVRLTGKDGIVSADKVNVALTRVALPLTVYQPPQAQLNAPTPPSPARTK